MPEDPTPDGPWPLPTGRDELLQRVVTAGQRKLLLHRLFLAAAVAALASSLAAGALLLRDPGPTEDATPAAITTTAPSPDETSSPEPTGPTPTSTATPTTSTTTTRPSSTSTPTGTTSGSSPGTAPVPPTTPRPPEQPGPAPGPSTTVTTTPPPTTRPGPSTTSPPPVTVGPVGAEPEAIVELQATGTAGCPGSTASVISAHLEGATGATLTWKLGEASGKVTMTIHAGTASAVLGPFDEGLVSPEASPSSVTVTVTATGPAGQAHGTTTVTLIDCPRR